MLVIWICDYQVWYFPLTNTGTVQSFGLIIVALMTVKGYIISKYIDREDYEQFR